MTRSIAAAIAIAAIRLLPAQFAAAEDSVLITSSDGRTPAQRQGQIVEFTGAELRLKSSAGREERIPASRVVEVRTTWTVDHLIGRERRKAGQLDEAIDAFQQAKEKETRPWARRQIMSEIAGCHAENGRFDLAGDEFLRIVVSDPTTRHFDVVPIPWRVFAPDAALETRAETWLAAGDKLPAAALLGASWLLSTSRRAEAIARLEELAQRRGGQDNVRIAMLAEVQLWRTKLVTAKIEDVARWRKALEQMPAEIQACGWFVVGEAFSRLKEPEEAALAYLRVPLVHGQQRPMAAEALVAAAKELETLKRTEQAAGLYREVVSDYATCPAAAEAQARLDALAKAVE